MAFKVRVGTRAQKRAGDVFVYIAHDLNSPRAAQRLFASYQAALASLSTFPRNNALHLQLSAVLGTEIRKRRLGNYLLLFFIDDNAQAVYVFSLIHGRQTDLMPAVQDFDELD